MASEGKGGIGCGDTLSLDDLPEICIAAILSFTSVRDVCRLSVVSTTLKSAAASDVVWESFLPSGYQDLIAPSLSFASKKELYFRLCDNPLIIDGGRKSFSLERGSGKKCHMLAARDLFIVWGDTPCYWKWVSLTESRFEEVAELVSVCWFEIRGKISISMLSPMTNYKSYLVYKATAGAYGFESQPVEVSVGLVGTEASKKKVYFDPESGRRQRCQIVPRRTGIFSRSRVLGFPLTAATPPNDLEFPDVRKDGWLEIELGEFFNEGHVDGELEMSIMEVKGGNWKGGYVFQGIEIRPSPCSSNS